MITRSTDKSQAIREKLKELPGWVPEVHLGAGMERGISLLKVCITKTLPARSPVRLRSVAMLNAMTVL